MATIRLKRGVREIEIRSNDPDDVGYQAHCLEGALQDPCNLLRLLLGIREGAVDASVLARAVAFESLEDEIRRAELLHLEGTIYRARPGGPAEGEVPEASFFHPPPWDRRYPNRFNGLGQLAWYLAEDPSILPVELFQNGGSRAYWWRGFDLPADGLSVLDLRDGSLRRDAVLRHLATWTAVSTRDVLRGRPDGLRDPYRATQLIRIVAEKCGIGAILYPSIGLERAEALPGGIVEQAWNIAIIDETLVEQVASNPATEPQREDAPDLEAWLRTEIGENVDAA